MGNTLAFIAGLVVGASLVILVYRLQARKARNFARLYLRGRRAMKDDNGNQKMARSQR